MADHRDHKRSDSQEHTAPFITTFAFHVEKARREGIALKRREPERRGTGRGVALTLDPPRVRTTAFAELQPRVGALPAKSFDRAIGPLVLRSGCRGTCAIRVICAHTLAPLSPTVRKAQGRGRQGACRGGASGAGPGEAAALPERLPEGDGGETEPRAAQSDADRGVSEPPGLAAARSQSRASSTGVFRDSSSEEPLRKTLSWSKPVTGQGCWVPTALVPPKAAQQSPGPPSAQVRDKPGLYSRAQTHRWGAAQRGLPGSSLPSPSLHLGLQGRWEGSAAGPASALGAHPTCRLPHPVGGWGHKRPADCLS
ncbi:Hypothetical predicted protein [Marmota monax]|uniref:Uncharacterized protein n=1 Tax=Marmota monax TaxID=9995 RepID=A0A5E4BBN5_MARMO|nr:Hypothetical predicted protein [Marmota monax]